VEADGYHSRLISMFVFQILHIPSGCIALSCTHPAMGLLRNMQENSLQVCILSNQNAYSVKYSAIHGSECDQKLIYFDSVSF